MAAGGVILGDLPPYEAFPIGGTNSVRGYSEGGVGSGRNYVAGTTALQWPIFGPVEVCDCCTKLVESNYKLATSICPIKAGLLHACWHKCATKECPLCS